ncbi:MAG TPA: beta-ketoacyl synthase N-terminal-like domain-containing protein [Jatrophihabitans sp.]|uniref:type I polyketide synthase n=1 Tax=Jatrophihabitans sp. TaxID=1932789 RepID=UPI002F24AE21
MTPEGEHGQLEPVAIIGMGCRFPGGITSPGAFWQLLQDNLDALGEVPAHRWQSYAARGPDYARAVGRAIKYGGYLDDIEGFDADFFGISPREAELMDPQQRVSLEVAWETLENAGIAPSSLAGSDTSVFMGVCCDDYGRRLLEDLPRLEAWTGIGSSMCAVANRVSYALDLRGPSVVIDTACSASLVAVHQACQSLRSGETSLALAGGVMLVASPSFALVLDAAGALSPDGTSKAFDAAANGYVRSEGCAVLALKRLADAHRDGDQVLAVVRGSAVCQDGRTNGIMAPSEDAQAHLVRQACRNAGVSPASIDYVEAHGTGTSVGDPIEIRALTATVGADRDPGRPCLIGSVKTNIGHLEAASGVAGIIKLVLSLRAGEIPATLSRAGLNPNIDWDGSGLEVVAENTAWPESGEHPRRGGVGNYGYGGTLAHVIVEQAPPVLRAAVRSAPVAGELLFPLSGASVAGLRANAAQLADWLRADEDTPLTAIGHTLAAGRSALGTRACVVAGDRAELAGRLDQLAAGRPAAGLSSGQVLRGATPPAAVWVFSGHGAQWSGMGRDLLRTEPLLGATFDEIEEIYQAELGFSPRQAVLDGDLGDVGQIQAMTFAMQVGLARIWRGYGLEPAAIIGHSVGEIAATVAAGMLELTDAARLICRRSRLLRRVAGQGAMAMVNLPFEQAEARLAGRADVTAAIAASPVSTVLSGSAAAVEQLLEQWPAEGLTLRRVNSDVAFHSAQMDDLVPDLLAGAADLPAQPGRSAVYNTALADPRANPPRDAGYWAANLRNPVRFAEAIGAAIDDGHRIFLEVSTHPVVAHSIMETLAARQLTDGVVVATLKRDRPERPTLLDNLGVLHCLGVGLDWSALYPDRELAGLPTTAWQHRRYWVDAVQAEPQGHLQHDVDSHTVLGHHTLVQGSSPVSLWQTRIDDFSRPYPGGHKVLDTEILPAAVVLTTFLAAAGGSGLTDVVLRVPIALTTQRDLQAVRQDDSLRLSSRLAGQASDQSWLTHSTAEVAKAQDRDAGRLAPALIDAGTDELDPGCVMGRLNDIGVVGIGFPWQALAVRRSAEHLLVRMAADPDRLMATATWGSLFDGGLSAAPILFPGLPRLRMPSRLSEVSVHGDPPAEAIVSVRLVDVQWGEGQDRDQAEDVEVDVTIADLDGAVLAEMLGVHFGVVQQAALPEPGASEGVRDQLDQQWHELPAPELAGYVDSAVRGVVSSELRMDPTDLDVHRPLSEMGVDSLLSESIRQQLNRRFGIALPSSLLWDRPSVAAVAEFLADSLLNSRASADERPAA